MPSVYFGFFGRTGVRPYLADTVFSKPKNRFCLKSNNLPSESFSQILTNHFLVYITHTTRYITLIQTMACINDALSGEKNGSNKF